MPLIQSTTIRRLLARAGTLLFVGVLLCVPGLTRVGQHIAGSRAPTLSFSKSTECPPRKMAAAPAALGIVAIFVDADVAACVACRRWAIDAAAPLSPVVFTPHPLRAPPSTLPA